jgi:hypothetical protein
LENLRIFSDEISGCATPCVTITVDGIKIVGGEKIIRGVIGFPECVCAFFNHASPIICKGFLGL